MPEQPTPPDYDPRDDPRWPYSPRRAALDSGQNDDRTAMAASSPTHTFNRLPDFTAQTRRGTANLGPRFVLRFEIAGLPDPVCMEMTNTLLLGRACEPENQFALDLNPYGGYWHGVSRQHAMIVIEDGSVKLTDLGSTNGTFLNGSPLPPNQLRILCDGDVIALSRLVMTIHFD